MVSLEFDENCSRKGCLGNCVKLARVPSKNPGWYNVHRRSVCTFSKVTGSRMLSKEGRVAITEVGGRVEKAFDVEKVTKRFYDEFKREHGNFSKFLKGLEGQDDLAWYTSVMLDRLMFIYFIQKKGFLDGDIDYLANKLRESKVRGANQFYRKFLIPLFFEGFAKEEKERSPEVNQLLGKVPYLNGGLFLPHQLEVAHGENINISDAAFEAALRLLRPL